MTRVLELLAAVALVAWRVRRMPLARCRKCKGDGKFVKGKHARRCPDCGGSGWRVRWLIKMFGGKK